MNLKVRYKDFLMAHFWHDLGKAFCLRAVMMVLGDKLRTSLKIGHILNIKNGMFLWTANPKKY